jgi:hypothetical protein
MNCPPIRSILALLLAMLLPLQGLAFAVQNVAAPSHFHPAALAAAQTHAHAHAHGHGHEHGPAAPHAHALDDDDVVYVIGDHDPKGSAGFKLPPQDGVPRTTVLLLAAPPREIVPAVAPSTGPWRSRAVEPLLRPPRG